MSQEEEEKIEQPESDKGKDNLEPSPPSVESNKEATTCEHTTYHCYKIEQPEKLYLGKFRMADLIQLGGVMLTFLTLIAFIYTSTKQINIANKSIEQTDSSLAYNKRSILASDSSTKEALRISDSSLAIAGKSLVLTSQNIKTIRDNARTELRAYIQADSVYFYKLKVGENVLVALRIANAGKTPAYNVKIIPSIRTNFMTINDTLFTSFIQGNSHFVDLIVVDSTKLTETDSTKMFTGEKPTGFNVKIVFTDVFGKSDSVDVCRLFDVRIKKFVLCENHQEHQYPK